MRRRGFVVEFEILAEHRQQMLLQAHHQRMHPGVEHHVGAFEAHLRRIARREILHMHRRRDHRAGNAQPLGDVALHLRAEHQFRLQLGDLRFDLQVIVGDQRLDAVELGGLAHFAGELAAVGAEPDDGEAELLGCDARGGDGMGGVAEDKDALAGQIGRIDRARIPGQPRLGRAQHGAGSMPASCRDFGDEFARRADADRHGPYHRLAEAALQPLRRRQADFRIQHDVEIGLAEPREIGRAWRPAAPRR